MGPFWDCLSYSPGGGELAVPGDGRIRGRAARRRLRRRAEAAFLSLLRILRGHWRDSGLPFRPAWDAPWAARLVSWAGAAAGWLDRLSPFVGPGLRRAWRHCWRRVVPELLDRYCWAVPGGPEAVRGGILAEQVLTA